MQRLFSTFPNGWPGTGLLVLRFAAASVVIASGIAFRDSPGGTVWLQALGIVPGLLLLAGLWTPLAGVAVAAVEAWYATQTEGSAGVHLVAAAVGLSLAALGPGNWSVDARLYGRRRIDV